MTETNTIHYGFGKEYLKTWGIKEALREIYQNFIDYGSYEEESFEDNEFSYTSISNNWHPESLDFLRIGNSKKNSSNAIGKHGEGLKMAFLILLREGFESKIITPKYTITPNWYSDKEIGDCYSLEYKENEKEFDGFCIEFQCLSEQYVSFKNDLILKSDIIFTDNYWGDIVNKQQGNIYSGGLFVCHAENIGKAYNILPCNLPLDRDRQVPKSFDVSYATSKINQAQGKMTIKDLSYSDTEYIDKVPEEIKKEFTPKKIGNQIQFTAKDEAGNDFVVQNTHIVNALKNDSFFASAINKIKKFIAKQLGLYDLLIEFKQKHVYSAEALADFEIILERVAK